MLFDDFLPVFNYKMVDISNKIISYRKACAFGIINVGNKVFDMIKNKEVPKGDPILLAEIAVINAVKNTNSMVLLCHNLNIESVFVNFVLNSFKKEISVYCVVFSNSKTGVEIEALLGVKVALLNIYDLTKKFNPYSYMHSIKLLLKDGGKSGLLKNNTSCVPIFIKKKFKTEMEKNFFGVKVSLLTVSDRASNGFYFDLSGNILYNFFIKNKATIVSNSIIPDSKLLLFNEFRNIIDKFSPNLILTTGGTGLGLRDFTQEVIFQFCDKKISGFGEFLRVNGFKYSEMSWLSDSIAGVYNKTLIVALPGKVSAVNESLFAIKALLFHAVEVINKSNA